MLAAIIALSITLGVLVFILPIATFFFGRWWFQRVKKENEQLGKWFFGQVRSELSPLRREVASGQVLSLWLILEVPEILEKAAEEFVSAGKTDGPAISRLQGVISEITRRGDSWVDALVSEKNAVVSKVAERFKSQGLSIWLPDQYGRRMGISFSMPRLTYHFVAGDGSFSERAETHDKAEIIRAIDENPSAATSQIEVVFRDQTRLLLPLAEMKKRLTT